MGTNGTIECATDLSAGGARAVDLAASVARDLGSSLRLVHASDLGPVGDPSTWTTPAHQTLAARVAQRVARLTELLDAERARVAASGLAVEVALVDGRPWEAVVQDATASGAQMIVIGPHGHAGPVQVMRSAAVEWLLGTTADRVVRHAPCPVLVAPHEGEIAPLAGGRWLVAVDFEAPSRDALALAARLAARCGATVTALHVVADVPMLQPAQRSAHAGDEPIESWDPELEEASALVRLRAAVDEVRAEIGADAPPVATRIARGQPALAVDEVASQLGATLIVVGTHGRRGVAHALLGSVAERVLRRARQPVLCVRARA